MPLVPDRPPQFSAEDLQKREAAERGERLVAYLNGLDLTGPPPAHYEGTRAGNFKYIIEDAQNATADTTADIKET